MVSLTTVLVLIALVFGLVELVRGNGRSLLCWAVVLLAFALLSPLVVR